MLAQQTHKLKSYLLTEPDRKLHLDIKAINPLSLFLDGSYSISLGAVQDVFLHFTCAVSPTASAN